MELYNVGLFVHILGAVVLVGMGFFFPIVMGGLRRTPTVAGVREWAKAAHAMAKIGNPAAALTMLTGLYMTWAEWSFAQSWIVVGLVLFLIAGGIAGAVLDPELKKLNEAAAAASDGPVPDDLRQLAAAPRIHTFESMLFGIDIAIVFLMTNKPGLVGSLVTAAVGVAIGAARIAMASRRHGESTVAA